MKNIDLPDIVTVPRTDPIYNAHGYLTKVPVGAIRPFIEEFTKRGDLVIDPFAGSGMTGVAAMMAGRRAELSDLSVLGRHVGRGFLSTVSASEYEAEGVAVVEDVRREVQALYSTVRNSDRARVEWTRTIWSYEYRCPRCAAVLNFYEEVTLSRRTSPESCPSCKGPFKKRDWECVADRPIAVVLTGPDGKQVEQPIGKVDLRAIAKASKDPLQEEIPSLEIAPEREMYRRCALAKWGLTKTRDFFTTRNALVLLHLSRRIDAVDDSRIREKLRFAFTAILPRASRRYQWSAKRPLNAQNQTYYISAVHFEWNVLELFKRKVRAAMRAQSYREANTVGKKELSLGDGVEYRLASADALSHVEDSSVDYVFTDPPFGSNIFYSDMNLFQEAWLGEVTDHAHEAVIKTGGREKQKDSATRYERLLRSAFREANRVLKPGRCMSVVFGNSSGKVWSMVQRAIRDAGFDPSPIHIALLDKGQRSVKGLASGREQVSTVDLVLTVQKPRKARRAAHPELPLTVDTAVLVKAAIKTLGAKGAVNPSYVYVAAIKEAIRREMPVDDLHLADVLLALASAGYSVDSSTGVLKAPSKIG